MRLWSGLVGAVVEAWQELRIHRTRVLLSLVGVAVAVCAITSIVGLGGIAEEASRESYESNGGQPANLQIYVNPTTDAMLPVAQLDSALATIVKRYGISYSSRVMNAALNVQFADGVEQVNTNLVDPDYATMHRLSMAEGSWFGDGDADRLAPAVVVNPAIYERLGSPPLATHPTIPLIGGTKSVGVIVGVLKVAGQQDYLNMYMLPEGFERVADPAVIAQLVPQAELWVPPALAAPLRDAVARDLQKDFGSTYDVQVSRQDYQAFGGPDPLLPIKLVVGGVAVLVLLLGALGLLNISMVTVRQRVREIGIRRSFGATAGRVFFSVMMESVVATVAAGVIGVAVAVLIVENPITQGFLADSIIDVPPFPVSAALLGLLSSTVVGALAGLLPALVAVRVRVIDAIRF